MTCHTYSEEALWMSHLKLGNSKPQFLDVYAWAFVTTFLHNPSLPQSYLTECDMILKTKHISSKPYINLYTFWEHKIVITFCNGTPHLCAFVPSCNTADSLSVLCVIYVLTVTGRTLWWDEMAYIQLWGNLLLCGLRNIKYSSHWWQSFRLCHKPHFHKLSYFWWSIPCIRLFQDSIVLCILYRDNKPWPARVKLTYSQAYIWSQKHAQKKIVDQLWVM